MRGSRQTTPRDRYRIVVEWEFGAWRALHTFAVVRVSRTDLGGLR
jgi:hypothetical protein